MSLVVEMAERPVCGGQTLERQDLSLVNPPRSFTALIGFGSLRNAHVLPDFSSDTNRDDLVGMSFHADRESVSLQAQEPGYRAAWDLETESGLDISHQRTASRANS